MASTKLDGALAGLSRVNAMAEEMSAIVRRTVGDVRSDGATWEQIGQALGVSKQAAHHRYGRRKEASSDA